MTSSQVVERTTMQLAFCLFNYYPYGGLEQSFLNITKEALAQGHGVDVYTRRWQGEIPEGLHVHQVPFSGLTNHARCESYVNNLQPLLRQRQFDLIVGFNRMPGLDLYYNADVCFINAAKRNKSPLAKLTQRYKTYAAFERAVFSPDSSTHIMYISESEKANYIRCYNTPESRFHYLPPGINKPRIKQALTENTRQSLRRELCIAPEQKMLLMIGSDFVRKGVKRAIQGVAALPESLQAQVKLVIVGRGATKPMIKEAQKLGISNKVNFVGGRDDVPRFLAAADYLLHPALSETAGNAILEAMVAGLPVFVSQICGFSFHVAAAEAGMVFNDTPFKQTAFNQQLTEFLSSSDYSRWKQNGLDYAENTDLYSRPSSAVTIMHNVAQAKKDASI